MSLSSEVLPEFREYERCSTTAVNAYLAPRLGAYLEQLAGRAGEAGLPAPLVMRSSGGVADLEAAAEEAAACLFRARPAAWWAPPTPRRASGFADVLTFDMGGTSTDVAPIIDGEARPPPSPWWRACPSSCPWSTSTR